MIAREEPVEFASRGSRLLGVLHRPEGRAERAVLLLSGGLASRVGPHRMYVKAARRLAALGVAALRFDFPGIGESEGSLETLGFDAFDAEDAFAAAALLAERTGAGRLSIFGLCTGARAAVKLGRALLERPLRARLDGLLLYSLPVMAESDFPFTAEYGLTMGKAATAHMARVNARKALSPRSWWRLVTGRSDYGFLARLAASLFRSASERGGRNAPSERLLRDARALLDRGVPLDLVFGEEDLLLRRCEEHFLPGFEAERARGTLRLVRVRGGHHSFDEPGSEEEALAFLERAFAAPVAAGG